MTLLNTKKQNTLNLSNKTNSVYLAKRAKLYPLTNQVNVVNTITNPHPKFRGSAQHQINWSQTS